MSRILIEKLDWEYNNFYNEVTSTSKANVYGRSAEIERKKRIVKYLRGVLERVEPEDVMKLQVVENILDGADRQAADHPEKSIERSAEDYIAGVLGEESPNKMLP